MIDWRVEGISHPELDETLVGIFRGIIPGDGDLESYYAPRAAVGSILLKRNYRLSPKQSEWLLVAGFLERDDVSGLVSIMEEFTDRLIFPFIRDVAWILTDVRPIPLGYDEPMLSDGSWHQSLFNLVEMNTAPTHAKPRTWSDDRFANR